MFLLNCHVYNMVTAIQYDLERIPSENYTAVLIGFISYLQFACTKKQRIYHPQIVFHELWFKIDVSGVNFRRVLNKQKC